MIGNQESYVTPVVSGKMSKQKELEVFGFLTLLLKHVILFFWNVTGFVTLLPQESKPIFPILRNQLG